MYVPGWSTATTLAAGGCSVWNGLGLQAWDGIGAGGGWITRACKPPMDVSVAQPVGAARVGQGTSTFHPLLPPAIPLAVRSPYLSAWLATGSEGGNGGYLAGRWAQFWPIQYPDNPFKYRLEWAGLIRVDNTTYEFMGLPSEDLAADIGRAVQKAFAYTSTRSIFTFEAGGVEFTATFFSPIAPGDLLKQSLPFSYLSIALVGSVDGLPHSVEVYTDIAADWASGDHDVEAQWSWNEQSSAKHEGIGWWEVGRKKGLVFAEEHEYAEWGQAVYGALNSLGSTHASGSAFAIRSHFVQAGSLTNQVDKEFRQINDRTPVFAHSTSLSLPSPGVAGAEDSQALFVIGHVRDPYVNYITRKGQQPLSAYWRATFPNHTDALHFFFVDHGKALVEAVDFDAKVQNEAVAAGGDQYAAIVTLSARQAMGTFELTMGKDSKGRWNHSDVMAFLKEISSNGDMSTVDVIFPAFPILTYLDPKLLKLLLEPLFDYSESGLYPNMWTVHDIGRYPNATGHNDGNDEPMPVEEAGNMLIMMLAYYQVTNDASFLMDHYPILTQWTSYLITDSLIPAEQLSTDDFAGTLANQTNLAVKGIVGIGAMAEIAAICGRKENATYYGEIAREYVHKWIGYAVSKDGSHTKLAYQDDQSWGTLYNLFADRLLNLNLFPHNIYDMQSGWYFTIANEFGVPLDSRHTWVKSDWQMWASATATSVSGRDLFTNRMVRYLEQNIVNAAFPDLYETESANFPGRSPTSTWRIEFINRPVSGGHFAHLALAKANTYNKVRKDPYGRPSPSSRVSFWNTARGFWGLLAGFIQRTFLPGYIYHYFAS